MKKMACFTWPTIRQIGSPEPSSAKASSAIGHKRKFIYKRWSKASGVRRQHSKLFFCASAKLSSSVRTSQVTISGCSDARFMKVIFLDIETVPTEQALLEHGLLEAQLQLSEGDLLKKLSLSATTAKILCLCYAIEPAAYPAIEVLEGDEQEIIRG